MATKLKANLNIVLAPAISDMQELNAALHGSDETMLSITKEIAQLTEQNHILTKLRERNLLTLDSFLAKNAELTARLSELKHQRRLLLESQDAENDVLEQLRELMRILKEAEIQDGFDEQLFADTVERVLVDSQQQLRFRLIGGLELAEPIRGKLR